MTSEDHAAAIACSQNRKRDVLTMPLAASVSAPSSTERRRPNPDIGPDDDGEPTGSIRVRIVRDPKCPTTKWVVVLIWKPSIY
jgi:hypothetical protein